MTAILSLTLSEGKMFYKSRKNQPIIVVQKMYLIVMGYCFQME